MHKSFKKQQVVELIKHSLDLYLAQNSDTFGFSHVIDVNMAEDLKTAYVYISIPVEKNTKKLENKLTGDNREIVRLFKESFTSKFLPKLKFVLIKDTDVKF